MMKLIIKLLDRLSEWASRQERMDLDQYLSQSQTIGELEDRMRKWQVK